MAEETVDLDQRGDRYVFIRTDAQGNKTEFDVSTDSMLKICQSAPRLQDRILAQRSRPGVDAQIVTIASRASLNHDIHKMMLHLGLFDQKNHETLWAVPLEVAKPLAEALPRWIAKLEAVIPTRTKQ
ncbi:MAG: hypothetical protein EPO08_03570 [Rhodospirillaceae bacterium]|nr:MAG: hypothetical protein EPO08_03570 [Rhodospirillaceae bacterium]